MLEYHQNPSDRKDVLINTLCDLLHLHDCPSISKDTMRALMKDLGVRYQDDFESEDDFLDDVMYWVKDRYHDAEVMDEHHRRNPPETEASLKKRMAEMKDHYDQVLFWTVIIGVGLLIFALFCR